jgi:hypothetical protein
VLRAFFWEPGGLFHSPGKQCSKRGRLPEVHLTLQPIHLNLRLIKHMHSRTQRVRIVALLLGIIFLGAQFHFCADASASATHFCPVCSVAGTALAAHSPTVAIIPATYRLEVVSLVLTFSSAFGRAVSPRAPPAL